MTTARTGDIGEEIQYRLARRPLQGRPGQHRSRTPGPGLEVHGLAALAIHPDARRIDMHASARDPFGQWIVRLPRQRSSATLMVLADLSASMTFGQPTRKVDALADLVESLAYSAWRGGDALGFIGADIALRRQWMLAPAHGRGAAAELAQRLRSARPSAAGAEAMVEAAQRFGSRRNALTFLVSDFHWPERVLVDTCAALAAADVVPVVLWARNEFDGWPRQGLAELQDLESGERRTVWFRPALADAMARAGALRRTELRRRFADRGWRAFFCSGPFVPSHLNSYFHGEDR